MIIGSIAFLFMTTLGFISRFDDGESHQFHDFSGWPGFIMLLLRLGLFVLFIA